MYLSNDTYKMTEDKESKLNKVELLLRRIILIIFLLIVLYLIFFKRIWIWKQKTEISETPSDNNIDSSASVQNDQKSLSWTNNITSWENNIPSWENNISSGTEIKIYNLDSSSQTPQNDITSTELQDETQELKWERTEKLTKLWSHYKTDWKNIYYKWELVQFVNADEFTVLSKNEVKEISGTLVNSDNLLLTFQDYETRLAMMNTIDDIILNEQNLTTALKDSSENGMYKIKSDYENLSQYNWKNQKWKLTSEQRAKFAVMYLYVKIAKKTQWTVYMEQALNELKEFIQNFDPNKLKTEITDENIKIKWNIWMDKHCIFLNWQLYACFLDEIF